MRVGIVRLARDIHAYLLMQRVASIASKAHWILGYKKQVTEALANLTF